MSTDTPTTLPPSAAEAASAISDLLPKRRGLLERIGEAQEPVKTLKEELKQVDKILAPHLKTVGEMAAAAGCGGAKLENATVKVAKSKKNLSEKLLRAYVQAHTAKHPEDGPALARFFDFTEESRVADGDVKYTLAEGDVKGGLLKIC